MRDARRAKKELQAVERVLLVAAMKLLECVPFDHPDAESNFGNVYLPGFDVRLVNYREALKEYHDLPNRKQ